MEAAVKGLEGWISCFEKSRLAGVVRGTSADKRSNRGMWGKRCLPHMKWVEMFRRRPGRISLVTTIPVAAIASK